MAVNILQGQNKENLKFLVENWWTKTKAKNFMCIALPEEELHKHTFHHLIS